MDIRTQSVDRNLLLEFSGELDHHAAKNAIRELELAVDTALPRRLVLDFNGVTFMDSSGIAVLLRAHRRVGLLGGTMTVQHVPDQAGKVLRAAGLDRLMKFE